MKNKDLSLLRKEMKKEHNRGLFALLDCVFTGLTSEEALKQWDALPPQTPTKECSNK